MICCVTVTVDFNSLWSRRFRNILRTWELRSSVRGFIVVGAYQFANFEMKTTSLISKFDSKFANFASKLQAAVEMACVSDNLKSWSVLTFKHQLDSEAFTCLDETLKANQFCTRLKIKLCLRRIQLDGQQVFHLHWK